jgi:hypothetical protein
MKSPLDKIMSPITSKSKNLELEFKEFKKQHQAEIIAFKSENLKLQKQIAKLKAKQITLLNEIKVLRTEYSNYVHDNPPPKKLTAEEKEKLQLYGRLIAEYERTKLQKVEQDKDI